MNIRYFLSDIYDFFYDKIFLTIVEISKRIGLFLEWITKWKIFKFWVYWMHDIQYPIERHPEQIILIEGKRGEGKSVTMQYLQTVIKDWYDVPVHIRANYKSKYAEANQLHDIRDLESCLEDSVIFIDEGNFKFSHRDYKNFPEAMRKICTQCRHLRQTVIIAVQHMSKIDKEIRDECDIVMKVSNWKHRMIWIEEFDGHEYQKILKMDEEGKIMHNAEGEDVIEEFKYSRLLRKWCFIATDELYGSYDHRSLAFGL